MLPFLLLFTGVSAPLQKPIYQDPSRTAEERAKDLVQRMTVPERIGQCMMAAPAIPRLGVDAYDWWNEALHGVARNGVATVFPQAIGMAATWDPALLGRVADVISTEARAKHAEALRHNNHERYTGLTLWSPNVNLFRDPRWGRGQETYGEDPVLSGEMGLAFVRGIQGNDPKYLKAVATPKHFAVHSGPEPLRHRFDATVTERELHESYLSQFERCIREGKAASTMSAYSGFNGIPCTASSWLLNDLLRKEWGFNGAVVSDVDSVNDLYTGHRKYPDAASASAAALKAGLDLNSGDTFRALPEALRRGLVTEADIDQAAVRLMTLRFRLGMFDSAKEVAYQRIPISQNDSPEHDRVALEAARKSIVLLKNDGILPLSAGRVKRVAILGPTGGDGNVLVGNYNGTPSHPVLLTDGLKRRLESKGIQVDVQLGAKLADGLPEPWQVMPKEWLRTADGQPGVKAEFTNDRNHQLVKTLQLPELNLAWDGSPVVAGVPTYNMSIKASTVVTPQGVNPIRLLVSSDDGVRVRVDGQLVIDNWSSHAEAPELAPGELLPGRSYRVEIEYFQAAGQAALRLGYRTVARQRSPLEDALAVARQADVVFLTLGITPDLEGEEMPVNIEGFAGGDRTTLELPATQRALLDAVQKLGKPVVLVLTGGSALSFEPGKANAVLDVFYPGQRGGDALADVVDGTYNPAGRLPVTFYRSVKDLPPFDDYHLNGRTYRYFEGAPLFPFGHGLSYTNFAYRPASAKVQGSSVKLDVPIVNIGGRDGEEVIQVYVRQLNCPVSQPIRRLVGFSRTTVARGKNAIVGFSIPRERFRMWDDVKHRFTVYPGKYELQIGSSSADIRSRVVVDLK